MKIIFIFVMALAITVSVVADLTGEGGPATGVAMMLITVIGTAILLSRS